MSKKFVTVGLDLKIGKILYQGPSEYEAVRTGMTTKNMDVKMYSIEDSDGVVTLGIYSLKYALFSLKTEAANGANPKEKSAVFAISAPVEIYIPKSALESLLEGFGISKA